MASAPKKVSTNTTKVISAGGTTTTSTSTTRQGGNVTTAKTTTIRKANAPVKASAARKSTAGKKTTSAPAKFSSPALGGAWLAGPNTDGWQLCAPVAVANSLLAVLGVEVTNGDIERLYKAAGGHRDSGVSVEAVLGAAATTGLAGYRLAGYRETDATDGAAATSVLLLSLGWTGDKHAVATVDGGHVAAWGASLALGDLDARIDAAWSLTWHGKAN